MKFLKIWLCCAALIASFSAGWLANDVYYCETQYDDGADDELWQANEFKRELIGAYEEYYDGAQELLNEIDSDRMDKFDNEKYYKGLHKIDSLYATQL